MFFSTWETCIWSFCTEFVYTESWHFDNDATYKIDDALIEHGGLLHVLPLPVHLKSYWVGGGNIFTKAFNFKQAKG